MALGKDLGVGLIGSGFMGRAHALAFRMVGGVFDLPAQPRLEILADANRELAANAAASLGFARSTDDWRSLVTDPMVDIVAITTPNALHKPMSLAAIAAGKHVYCEKPLATSVADAKEMTEAAEAKGVVTLVGFNYLRNPVIRLAKEIVDSGEIGTITSFRGIHAEDFMADPSVPYNWRCDPANAGGALADIGSHITSMARYLVGDIEAVCGQLHTQYRQRPSATNPGEMRDIKVDDQANILVRFAGGIPGTITANWIATGRKMQLAFELYGTKGSLEFTQDRFNELKLYAAGQTKGRDGFKLINSGPSHPDYGAFCPASGHQIGFNDLKVIEVKTLIDAIAGRGQTYPDFREAWTIARTLEAATRSSQEGRWVNVSEI
jgi:predicted dehydrogenase